MVDEDRYCIDIVTQISAVRAALRRVAEEVLRDHVAHCVEPAIASGDADEQRRKVAELMAVLAHRALIPRPDPTSGHDRGTGDPPTPRGEALQSGNGGVEASRRMGTEPG
jgi:DNA-binding FrmR family transcriptional regulator